MDIRTKLVFALVAVALGSMFILGAITYSNAERLLTASTLEQLEGLADTKQERLNGLISDWKDRVRLAASPTPLRTSLRDYNRAPTAGQAARTEGHLADALGAVYAFESLTVYDTQGRQVASVARAGQTWEPPAPLSIRDPTSDPVFVGTLLVDGRPHAAFVTPLTLDGEALGFLRVAMDGGELLDVTRNRAGLGDTGETLIVARDEAREGFFVTPPRHSEEAAPGRLGDPATRALTGEEGEFTAGLVDYRGEPVWAALRYLPETEWGLVVKFDVDEERAPIDQFRRDQAEVGIALAAFAILIGILLGLRFAKPIHDLAEVTTRIRHGDLEARASASREDEIGMLGRTFNDMADELEQRMTALNEFKTFFDLSRDMLCIGSTDGTFKLLNPAFEQILGWKVEQLVNQPFVDFIHPDDVEATNREVEKLAQGIPTISFENRYRCADGTYKHLRWTSHPEPETGLLYAVARDITDRRAED